MAYKESGYRFTDPIRLFKANDPYYFEVDNIPLKQIHENSLWLKDQLGGGPGGSFLGTVTRGNIEELRPYATGADRVVRVKPGRYSARINDAYSRDPLSFLQQVGNLDPLKQGFFGGDEWEEDVANTALQDNLYLALDKFKSVVASEALGSEGFTGIITRWAAVNEVSTPATDPEPNDIGQDFGASLEPLLFFLSHPRVNSETYVKRSLYGGHMDNAEGYRYSELADEALIRKWRGVARTSIVDVPEELTVEVPEFDPQDFSYIDETGQVVTVPGVQSRIDLVFIYSKPIDRKETTIMDGGGKQTITTPQLGIVRGAGIKLDKRHINNLDVNNTKTGNSQPRGTDNKILASPADQFNDQMGFTAASGNDIAQNIRGSFPSPDDLMNLAPLISDNLESEAYQLIGQTIMPVAYVWVRGGGNVTIPISVDDVVDIRPFFRTTELTYNERVGIAAAVPPLSIANPAVGKGQLDKTAQNVKNYTDAKVLALQDSIEGLSVTRKVLATGIIQGGAMWGPEAALINYYWKQNNNLTQQELYQIVADKHGYFNTNPQNTTNTGVSTYPAWDYNTRVRVGSDARTIGIPGIGNPFVSWTPQNFINTYVCQKTSNDGVDESIAAAATRTVGYTTWPASVSPSPPRLPIGANGTSEYILRNNVNTGNSGQNNFRTRIKSDYVRRKIRFNRPDNLLDYNVDVTFLNCTPLSQRSHASNSHVEGAFQGVHIEKGYDYFIIYVFFNNEGLANSEDYASMLGPSVTNTQTGGGNQQTQETLGDHQASWYVLTQDIEESDPTPIPSTAGSTALAGYSGNPRIGKCWLPTVQFSMTGIRTGDITSGHINHHYNMTPPNAFGGSQTLVLDDFDI